MHLAKIIAQGDRVVLRLKEHDPAGGRSDYTDIIGSLEEAGLWMGYLTAAMDAARLERQAIEERREKDLLRQEQQILRQLMVIQAQLKVRRPDEQRPSVPIPDEDGGRLVPPTIAAVILSDPSRRVGPPTRRNDPLASFRRDPT
jgi:hypothetical protein